ncbi:DUF833-domain-containing protein [Whalleya microplaca]|nr:DUF833-domain-containing protein [Whalleya microplaca]
MCIVLLTTAHPKYALIAVDNRDEYVLRPTSRPHWWTHQPSGEKILSSRDLHRRERGTWLGVSKRGRFAVLTNYRESSLDDPDPEHAIHGVKSRGVIPNAWLGAPAESSLDDFVSTMLEGRAVKSVGGFSLVCGDLRRKKTDQGVNPLAIISNRWDHVGQVPWICGERGKTYGLSNAVYTEPPTWEKITIGEKLMKEAIQEAADQDLSEEQLTERLFKVLDHDTLPLEPKMTFQEHMDALRQSVFIRSFADDQGWKDMADAADEGRAKAAFNEIEDHSDPEEPKDASGYFMKGAYGTQRQTIILLDWEGNVTYIERALFDTHGNTIERGKGDEIIKFKIEEEDS